MDFIDFGVDFAICYRPMRSAYLIIAHGSREKESNQAFEELLEKFRKAYPDRLIEGAFLEIAKPGIPEAIETCIQKNAAEIFILPLMLFPGRHVKEHIPRFIEQAKASHPEVDFHYAGPLSDHPLLISLLEEKADQFQTNR